MMKMLCMLMFLISVSSFSGYERAIYKNYLIGLRQTRKIQNFMNNTSLKPRDMYLVGVKKIHMSNVVLDVSGIKEIHIKTKKDKIIIELDNRPILPVITKIDSLVESLSLLSKVLNNI